MDLTPLQRVADVLLREQGSDLTTFLRERSDLGVPATRIAAQLAEATGGEVDITDQAVRNWLRQFSDRAAA